MNIETAKRLLEYRKANGFSQEELAEKIGVSRQAISKWERSESSPDTDNLIALAKLYGVTIDELINGTQAPKKATSDNDYPNSEEKAKENPQYDNKNEPHIDTGKNKVNIGFDGIHIESQNGDKVHIGEGNGIHIESSGNPSHIVQPHPPKNPWLHALLPCLAVSLYLLLGFTTHRGWATGWILFLFIPIIETAAAAIKSKNPNHFAYPVFAAALFLICGMVFGVWHPTWIIFITIPAYYALCDAYKKTRKNKEDDFSQYKNENGTIYYSPEVSGETVRQKKHNNITTIIITVICAITIISIVGVTCTFAFLENLNIGNTVFGFFENFGFNDIASLIDNFDYDNANSYSVGSAEVSAEGITELSVEWISGNIDVEYYEGSTISFSEPQQSNKDYTLRYTVNNNELKIKYCKSGSKIGTNSGSKNLTIYLPQNLNLNKIDIESISSNITVDGISAYSTDFSTVSGNVNASGSFSKIDSESVSGNVLISCNAVPAAINGETISGDFIIALPKDIDGFSLEYDTASGSISTIDFDSFTSKRIGEGNHIYGNGNTHIDFESISGSLTVSKAP